MAPTNFTDTDIEIDMDESSSGVSDAAANPIPGPKTNNATSRRATLWLGIFAVLVIGASIAGGYFLAMQQGDRGTTGTLVSDADQPSGEPANSESMGVIKGTPLAGEESEITPLPEGSETDSSAAKETGIDILVDLVGARVSLDGHYLGKAPLRVRNILPGSHQIVVANADRSKVQERVVELILGEAKVLSVVLDDSKEPVGMVRNGKSDKSRDTKGGRRNSSGTHEKKLVEDQASVSAFGAEKVLLGTLMLGSKPPCAIKIDGKSTGKSTPQRAIQLPEGLHRVVLTNEAQGIRKSFKVVIKAGRTTRAIQDLRQKL